MVQTTDERLIDVLQSIAKERNISFEMLLEGLEAALLTAYKRHYGSEANAIVVVDRQTGEYKVYHRRTVVEEVADPRLEIALKEAGEPYQIGDFFDEEVKPKDFGRIAAQTAKQVIVQRIREAERDTVFNKYSRKLNDLVTGTVQRYEQRNMYVLLENRDEAILPVSEQVPGEVFRIGDFIRAYVLDVRKSPKGPQVVLSRSSDGLVQWRSRGIPACGRRLPCVAIAPKSTLSVRVWDRSRAASPTFPTISEARRSTSFRTHPMQKRSL
jgi:N utilization substance protein A